MPGYAVELSGLAFTWPKSHGEGLALDSLRLEKGGRLFVAGESGSGKSTLLALIGGIVTPQQGELRVLGQSFAAMPAAKRDRFRVDNIGFIFQQFNLIPYLTVLENVLLPCRFSAVRLAKTAEQGGPPEDVAGRLLETLDLPPPLWKREAGRLSVGQQQRVAAARALIGRPPLIVADEPTSALDAAHQADFIALLMKECGIAQSALIFVSHDERLAEGFSSRLTLASRHGKEAA